MCIMLNKQMLSELRGCYMCRDSDSEETISMCPQWGVRRRWRTILSEDRFRKNDRLAKIEG